MDKNTGQGMDRMTVADHAAGDAVPPVAPVRSAKDAINAMYAQGGDKKLSNYLAASAKEIINASNRPGGDTRSASNLHRGSIPRKMESARPSASGLFKTAKGAPEAVPENVSVAMDPLARKTTSVPRPRATKAPVTPSVVKTSLKLGPKKTPVTMRPQGQPIRRRSMDMKNPKGATALAQLLAERQAAPTAPTTPTEVSSGAEESVRVMQEAARQVTGQPEPIKVSRPKKRTTKGLMQDVVRPVKKVMPTAPAPEMAARSASSRAKGPIDSFKRRFRPAPKDFVAEPEVQAESYAGFAADDMNPPMNPPKPPVEIYGMMDEEPTGKPAKLGVVEDYHPQGDVAGLGLNENKVAQGSGKASPDNNKYALGGQSPFFLKSVRVEKRPLSDGPAKTKGDVEGTLYERPSTEPIAGKNIYEKRPSKKQSLPTKPTVIIPASRRSKAPLILLLLITVILGAAVGAFVYLFFFSTSGMSV